MNRPETEGAQDTSKDGSESGQEGELALTAMPQTGQVLNEWG